MVTCPWGNEYLLGVYPLDRQHKEIHELCSTFLYTLRIDPGPEQLKQLCLSFLNRMHNTITLHVLEEEKFMRKNHFPQIRFQHHKNLHRDYLALLRHLARELESGPVDQDDLNRLTSLVIDGWYSHISGADQCMDLYAPNLRPYPEPDFFACYNHAVSRLFSQILGADARTRILCREYTGENLGRAVYLRQVYASFQQDSKITILTAPDMDLLMGAARSMFHDLSLSFSPMLFSIAEELSAIYMWQVVLPMLPHPDPTYRLVESKFLTYQEWSGCFYENHPSLASLFLTNAMGSFALGVDHQTPEVLKLKGLLYWPDPEKIKNAVIP